MSKKNKSKRSRNNPRKGGGISGAVLKVFRDNSNKPLNYKQVAAKLDITDDKQRQAVSQIMKTLAKKGKIEQVSPGKYAIKDEQGGNKYIGKLDMNQRGAGYVMVPDLRSDIYVRPENLNGALHGDTVEVQARPNQRGKLNGKVVDVVERAHTSFVGVLDKTDNYAFVIPDNPKMSVDIFVQPGNLNGAEHGQKVVVEIKEWGNRTRNPSGFITEKLGKPGEVQTEMAAILLEKGFAPEYPKAVVQEAEAIPKEITPAEIKQRRDMRQELTFTIDPADAKDFDDALSFKQLENGNYEIGVHIADVTHYVKKGGAIDEEALLRSTSVYLVDRVIPMLPEVLSNELCSLRPHEDKLTYSCVFEMDQNAQVQKKWIGRTVTHSNHRFTYEDVQAVIEGKDHEYAEAINTLNSLASQLRNRRTQKGSISFTSQEMRFELNEKKEPVSVIFKIQKDAHKLIEDFMLLANRTVAESVGKVTKKGQQAKTFVYRIHDHPDPDKLADFASFIKKFGHDYEFSKRDQIAGNMNALLSSVHGAREASVVSQLAIRTMAKAEYSTENIGHFGLGFHYYSHFTSPIRRYPDMMVHRLLTQYENSGKSADADTYERWCEHCSDQERLAAEAERDSTKFYQALYLKDHIGERFTGVVSGMTEWGMFVAIEENGCEGMMKLRDIEGDYYTFDEENYRVVGSNRGKTINLGDTVTIEIVSVDLIKKQIDFAFVSVDDAVTG